MSPFCQQKKTKKWLEAFPLQLSDILGDLYYFAKFAEHKLADFAWKLSPLQFSNKSMLQSAQQINKFDLNHYGINHQWFREGYIVFA